MKIFAQANVAPFALTQKLFNAFQIGQRDNAANAATIEREDSLLPGEKSCRSRGHGSAAVMA
jgi:hypothetical protein